MLLCPTDTITLSELPLAVSESEAAAVTSAALTQAAGLAEQLPEGWIERPWREVRRVVLDQVERAYIAGLLQETGGRVGETARRAGMRPRSLFEKMRRHGLRKEDYRPAAVG
jgi:DNA-binding NtrC family response regulator